MLESLDAAIQRWSGGNPDRAKEAEVIVIRDDDGMGPSWARNRGLERAKGDYVFFCDADDTVAPDFITDAIREMEETNDDFCIFGYDNCPDFPAARHVGSQQVRDAFLPAYFGYSFDDVRRWNKGGSLRIHKDIGSVWRAVYRRAFLERNQIRFDESLMLFEDAAFLSNCAAHAHRASRITAILYHYRPLPTGFGGTGYYAKRHWAYKFKMLDYRKRLDQRVNGEIWRYCEASCVLSALEMLRMWRRVGLTFAEFRADMKRYLSDEKVRKALRMFPCSLRHPLVAMGVFCLRALA